MATTAQVLTRNLVGRTVLTVLIYYANAERIKDEVISLNKDTNEKIQKHQMDVVDVHTRAAEKAAKIAMECTVKKYMFCFSLSWNKIS